MSPEKNEHLQLYRLVILIGAPLILLDGYLVDSLQASYSQLEVITRNVAAVMAFASFCISYFSQWWRKYIGEITVIISYAVIANAAVVVFDSHIATYESYYAIATIVMLGMTFHKIPLVIAFEIPAVIAYVTAAYLTSDPLMEPGLFAAVIIIFAIYALFFSTSFQRMRKRRSESEAISNLWFDQGADAMLFGRTDTATPSRVNPRAHKLFETTENETCGQLVRVAFFKACTDSDPEKTYRKLMQIGEWNDVLEIPTAKGNTFWGNIAMRRLFIGDQDLTLIRVSDVSSEVAHEQALKVAKEAAEAAVQTRSQFLANMSHEIRTPMNGVIGMTSLLLETELNPEQKSYLETTRTSGESLLTIINEILDFSKIDANKIELEQQVFNLENCIAEALDIIAPSAVSKNLELLLSYHVYPGQLFVGDVTRIRQVLVNLLSNAIKFTDAGEVLVEINDMGINDLQFSVTDTGAGIDKDKQATLFQPFTQADASTTRKFGGTGLGLTICKGLVEKMGGHISIASESGKGSCFTFNLPLHKFENKSDVTVPNLAGKSATIIGGNSKACDIVAKQLGEIGIETQILDSSKLDEDLKTIHANLVIIDADTLDESKALLVAKQFDADHFLRLYGLNSTKPEFMYDAAVRKPLRPSELHETVIGLLDSKTPNNKPSPARRKFDDLPVSGKSFLLAEDNLINQKVAVQMSKKLGIRLDVVANGLEALEIVQHRNYDYIFMDVQMPELDGLEATQRIRQMEKIKQPYIIAMTANAMQEDKNECLNAGMNDFISKPLDLEKLHDVLRSAMDHPNL